jgi:hypothetical protein
VAETTEVLGISPDFGDPRGATITSPSCVSRIGSYDIGAVSARPPYHTIFWCGLQAQNVEEFNILDAERDNRRKEGRIVLVLVKIRCFSAGLIDPNSGRIDGD